MTDKSDVGLQISDVALTGGLQCYRTIISNRSLVNEQSHFILTGTVIIINNIKCSRFIKLYVILC